MYRVRLRTKANLTLGYVVYKSIGKMLFVVMFLLLLSEKFNNIARML